MIAFLSFALIASALLVAGVWVVAGLGWALIAASIPAALTARVLAKGIAHG